MDFLFLLTLLIYLAASIFHAIFLTTGDRKIDRIAYWVTIGGFALHSFYLVLRWLRQGEFPMAYWYDSASFFAWAIILIYLCIAHLTRLRTVGSFVVPAAFIANLIAYTLPKGNAAISPALQNYWLITHSSFIFLAYAAFVAAFGFGLMYLIEEKRIREKKHTLLYNLLPALGRSDRIGHKCVVAGVVLMTIGIIIGVFWTRNVPEVTWKWVDPKVIFTIATWLIYVLQLSIRQVFGWYGRKTAYSAIVGFAAVLFTYVGVNLFLPSMHAF